MTDAVAHHSTLATRHAYIRPTLEPMGRRPRQRAGPPRTHRPPAIDRATTRCTADAPNQNKAKTVHRSDTAWFETWSGTSERVVGSRPTPMAAISAGLMPSVCAKRLRHTRIDATVSTAARTRGVHAGLVRPRLRKQVDVVRRRDLELLLDAFHPGGQAQREPEVRVAGRVRGSQLDAAGVDAKRVGAVVAAPVDGLAGGYQRLLLKWQKFLRVIMFRSIVVTSKLFDFSHVIHPTPALEDRRPGEARPECVQSVYSRLIYWEAKSVTGDHR